MKKRSSHETEELRKISYKDIKLLSRFVTERGKILPRKITGLTVKEQRLVTRVVKQARQVGFLPFVNYGESA